MFATREVYPQVRFCARWADFRIVWICMCAHVRCRAGKSQVRFSPGARLLASTAPHASQESRNACTQQTVVPASRLRGKCRGHDELLPGPTWNQPSVSRAQARAQTSEHARGGGFVLTVCSVIPECDHLSINLSTHILPSMCLQPCALLYLVYTYTMQMHRDLIEVNEAERRC